jgi:hypothetical protein
MPDDLSDAWHGEVFLPSMRVKIGQQLVPVGPWLSALGQEHLLRFNILGG